MKRSRSRVNGKNGKCLTCPCHQAGVVRPLGSGERVRAGHDAGLAAAGALGHVVRAALPPTPKSLDLINLILLDSRGRFWLSPCPVPRDTPRPGWPGRP